MLPSLLFLRRNGRWLGIGFSLLFLSSFGQTFFVSAFGGEIRAAFALTNGGFGAVYMAVTLASALTLTVVGPLADRMAPRPLVAGTLLALAAGAALLASANGIAALALALFVLRLAGQGMSMHLAYTLVGRWFGRDRGRAVSLVSLGLNTAQAALPILFVTLAAALGWRGAWGLAALFLLLVAAPLVTWLVRGEPPESPQPAADAPAPRPAILDRTRSEALRDPFFPLLLLATLPPAFVASTVFFHQAHLAEVRGWPAAMFPASLPIYAALTVVTLLVAGPLVDRLSARALLPFYLLPFALGLLVLGTVEGPLAVVLFMMLYALTDGLSLTIFGTLWPEIYGTRHLGAIRAVIVAVLVMASALGPGLAGVLIDLGVRFPTLIAAMGIACAAISALMLALCGRLDRRLARLLPDA